MRKKKKELKRIAPSVLWLPTTQWPEFPNLSKYYEAVLSYKSLWSFFKYSKASGYTVFGSRKICLVKLLEKSEYLKNPLVKKSPKNRALQNFLEHMTQYGQSQSEQK